jgi:antitoxin Phd
VTIFRPIDANRRNAGKVTGPATEEGKQRSRCNTVRHGLTAEDCQRRARGCRRLPAFEAAIVADYDARSARIGSRCCGYLDAGSSLLGLAKRSDLTAQRRQLIFWLEILASGDEPMASRKWSVQDAKNRFSEVVEAARRVPQTVTKHGKPAVVVVDVAEYERLQRLDRVQAPSFAELLLAMPQDGDEFPRLKVRPRDVEL